MRFKFQPQHFFLLTLGFVLFTAIGTVSHEYGHILVAKAYGYETQLHYGMATFYPKGYTEDPSYIALDSLFNEYPKTPYLDLPENVKKLHQKHHDILQERYWNDNSNDGLFITIGGPLQTMLTGICGLTILFCRRKLRAKQGFKLVDWLGVFLSLFWLREVFNLVMSVTRELISPNGEWFGGDEEFISAELGLWDGTLSIILGALGLAVSLFVIFKIVPSPKRFTFIASGLVGGIIGFVLWMDVVGPILLP